MPDPTRAEWFVSVLDALEEFVIVKGDRSRLLWANRSFCEYYGMDNATLASLIDAEHSDPDDTLKYVRDDHEVWTSGNPLTVIEAVTRHDGEVRFFETTKRAVRADGETVLTVGISRPASKEDAAASASERSERKLSGDALRSFVSSFPGPVVVVDVKQRVVAASREFVKLLDGEDIIIRGRELETLLPMDEVALRQVLDTVSSGSELSLKDLVVLGGERYFDLHVAPWHLPGGQAVGTMIRLNEVTELRATERRLVAEHKALRSIINAMNVGVATVDEEGGLNLCNAPATRMTGITPGDDMESEQHSVRDRDGVEVPLDELPMARALRGEHVEHEVLKFEDDGGDERWLTVSATPVKDVPGHAAVAVFTDITERIQVQRELEEFAYVASHDLQEPLRMVRSYVNLLQEEYGDRIDGDGAKYMRFAVDGADRMQALVRDLLVFSQVRKRELVLAPTDMNTILETVRDGLSRRIAETGGTISFGAMPTVLADSEHLIRLFENLFSNALKFSRPGVAPRVNLQVKEVDDGWTFEVDDNGIGIEPAYADKIFKMFHRLNPMGEYPGTGIGLAICKRIMARHGGSIALVGKETEGSRFSIWLPKKHVAKVGGLW